jgi:menaquinone-dependent protoporphyrinogen IX oxidase
MRALVVYESMYGNTHAVASNVADGLRGTYEVTLAPVADATADLIAEADLVVVGAPTHMHQLSTASSRQTARKAAAKPDSGLTLDPDAGGPAVRDWLSGLAATLDTRPAAAFDTRLVGAPVLTGRASRGIGRLLTRHGYRLIVPPESFLVTKLNTLVDGESSRARQWGEVLAAETAVAAGLGSRG